MTDHSRAGGRREAVGVLLGVMLFLPLVGLMISAAQHRRLDALAERLDRLSEEVDHVLAVGASLPELDAEIDGLEAELCEGRRSFTSGRGGRNPDQVLQRLAKSSRVELLAMTPRPIRRVDGPLAIEVIRFEIQAQAEWSGMEAFLDGLGRHPRTTAVPSLRVRRNPPEAKLPFALDMTVEFHLIAPYQTLPRCR